jgi:acetoin:2,6-dichlorophenolindophenol oxidoreductase subunit alpha
MAGKVRKSAAKAAVSTGGSLLSDAKLKQLYATMMQCRLLTERVSRLRGQPAARGQYSASMGQEAIATGCVVDLQPADTVVLAPQDSIAGLVKGAPLSEICSLIYQSRTSPNGTHNIIPASASPAGQADAAIDAAQAYKRKKHGNVVVAFTGQADNIFGHWHKAIELAAKRSLSIIFVAENNPWSETAGGDTQDEDEEFTNRARGYGIPFITVDGNDVVAVYRVAHESLERVRQGAGPVLVESKTYRLAGRAARPGAWRSKRDPLTQVERYLKAKKLFSARAKNQIVQEFSRELDAAMRAAKVPR